MTPPLEMGLQELVRTLARVLESKPSPAPAPEIGPDVKQEPEAEPEPQPASASPAILPTVPLPPAVTNTSLPFSDTVMALAVSMHFLCVVWLASDADSNSYRAGPTPNVLHFVAAYSVVLLIAGTVRRRWLEVAIPIVPLFASVPFWLGVGTDAGLLAFAAVLVMVLLLVYLGLLLKHLLALRKKAVN
jgi:hypothetical protein